MLFKTSARGNENNPVDGNENKIDTIKKKRAILNTENVLIETLSFDSANVRTHNEKNIRSIKESLKRFGQQKPIVVDSNNVVRAGNGTLQAAKELGWTSIDVAYSKLTSDELTAYAIADNRTAELAEWDMGGLKEQLGGLDEELREIAYEDFPVEEIAQEPDDGEEKEIEFSSEQKETINQAWAEWCKEVLLTLEKMEDIKIFSQAYNKAHLKISFLNALYRKKKISRSATLGYHRMLCSGDGKNGSIIDLINRVPKEPKKL